MRLIITIAIVIGSGNKVIIMYGNTTVANTNTRIRKKLINASNSATRNVII
jgi:hypothetical protein